MRIFLFKIIELKEDDKWRNLRVSNVNLNILRECNLQLIHLNDVK